MRQLHAFEPFDEAVLQRYLGLLALAEKRHEALAIYEHFTGTLALEINAEPGADTIALMEQIRAGKIFERVSSSRKARLTDPLAQARKKMPIPATHFIGRETKLSQLIGLLRDPACRLLTLVGAGGMGKTRLAIEVANRLEAEFRDGVCFMPFEAVDSPELIVTAVADALGFTFLGQQDPKTQLFNYLKTKRILLVADNLEHLVRCAKLFGKLLEKAPTVTILATSCQTLNLQAEWVYDVTGMSVLPTLYQSNDAVTLFVQAAKRARASYCDYSFRRKSVDV